MSAIFVTGGTGFLGRTLVPMLVAEGHVVRLLVRQPEAHPWLQEREGLTIVRGDLNNREALAEGMTGCSAVIHGAGLFRLWGRAEQFQRVNVEGTRHVVQAAVEAGVGRFVHISTVAVIGRPLPGYVIDESHPARPLDPYQQSKLEAERIVLSAAKAGRLPAIILRPGAYYGPGGHYGFNRLFFEDPRKGLLIRVHGGRHIIFPAYIRDVARVAINALERGRCGEIYNVCGEPLTHNEINAIVSEEAGLPAFRLDVPAALMIGLARVWTWLSWLTGAEPYYPINLRHYVFADWPVSSQKAREELAFHPTPFREGARQTLRWYRSGAWAGWSGL